MADREKTIKGLEICAECNNACAGCPYKAPEQPPSFRCLEGLLHDALELLKSEAPSKEPARLLTVDEVKAWRSWKQGQLFIEVSLIGALLPCFTEGETVGGETRFWLAAYQGEETWQGLKYYGATWRCWAGKPTKEEQEKWAWRSITDVEREGKQE